MVGRVDLGEHTDRQPVGVLMAERREELDRHVEWLTTAIEAGGSGSEIASLIRERRLTVDALAALPAAEQETSIADQLAAKRQARISGSDDHSQPARRSQPRRSGRVHPAS